MTARPKRAAAKPLNIIEISDSESENEPPVKKAKEEDNDCSSVDSDFRVEGTRIVEKFPAKKKIGRPKKSFKPSANEDEADMPILISSNPHPWKFHELLAEKTSISPFIAQNIITLLGNDNTIPFICRYRKDMVGNITPEKMRDIKTCFQEILTLQQKADGIVKTLEKDSLLRDDIKNDILAAKTLEELEFLYAPYKPANKGSLADRAKALGLEEYAKKILYGSSFIKLDSIVDKHVEGLESVEKVLDGIVHIISHILSKNTEVLEELRRIQKIHRITLKCLKYTSKDKKQDTKNVLQSKNGTKISRKSNEYKFELYYNFENAVRYIKPHQILAINRGEKAKCLSVKLIVPDRIKNEMKHYIRQLFLTNGQRYHIRNEIFEKSYEECYTKKLLPFLQRQVRSDLNEIAKKASIEVFAKNLKQLLLMSPLKGKRILGIDPGFSNGCKMALINETADILGTGVIFPHTKGCNKEQGRILAEMLKKHDCNLIALGNGTACRETEVWLTNLFKEGIIPEKIKYCIVSEQGASIYSCSENAKKEFPDLDVNIISAVSIARRLNDPLSEYVKIEPRHIGVGMYQHDVNEKDLVGALHEVVTECVSFVGVDINTASLSILQYISGLTTSRAQKLIEYRMKNGPFRTRRSIVKVKSIGEKTYTQCAGFIRIDPMTVGGSISNYLDCTWVHPESYDVAKSIIEGLNFKVKDIGQKRFIEKIQEISNPHLIEAYSKEYNLPKERIEYILEGLKREPFKDYRLDFDKKPLFKSGISRMADLSLMDVVTGAVTNITHFGAFIDIGVEKDCLLHVSKMNGMMLNIGDRVQCSVVDIDKSKNRVNLRLEEMSI